MSIYSRVYRRRRIPPPSTQPEMRGLALPPQRGPHNLRVASPLPIVGCIGRQFAYLEREIPRNCFVSHRLLSASESLSYSAQ